jgi:ABC-2 type transport system ATP-binding protein
MSEVIRSEKLVKRFGKVRALDGLDLAIPEGAIYALVGPNGAGKTTAIKVLMNIFPPTSGRAEVLGQDSRRLAAHAFTRIGYVSENQELPDWMRMADFLDYLRSFYPNWDRALEDELLKQLELPLDRKLGEFSRGMRMKAALASSLAYHPKLIVLDEPFGGLDPLVRDQLIEGLLERAMEATIFISSHDLSEIESLASHVGYLDQGRLRISEEMTGLTDRFREVEITLDGHAAPQRTEWPPSWMRVEFSGSVLRFIECRFDQERTSAEIRKLFASVRGTTFTPMSLRSIFLALAKGRRGST